MSRFQKLSHVIWHCQYHIVWVPKYRYKVLKGKIGEEVRKTIIVQSERLGCEIVELNVQVDHVHLLIKIPPKVSISSLMGVMKGKSASSESLFLSKDFPCSQRGNPQKYRDKLDCYASPSRPGHSFATQQGDGSHALQ